jgi:hypothetical protein
LVPITVEFSSCPKFLGSDASSDQTPLFMRRRKLQQSLKPGHACLILHNERAAAYADRLLGRERRQEARSCRPLIMNERLLTL